MKKLTALILALMLTMSLPLPAQAAYEFELLYDATEKLDREMCWELGAVQLVELSDTYKTQLRVDVVNSLEDYTLEEYAQMFSESFEYGYGDTKDGILLMISKAEGHYTILPMGQCELLVGEQAIGELSDILIAEFDADRPSQGLLRYIDKCDDILSGVVEYTEEVLTPEPEPQEEENGIFTYAVIAAGLVLCYLIIRKPKKKNESTAKEQEDQP